MEKQVDQILFPTTYPHATLMCQINAKMLENKKLQRENRFCNSLLFFTFHF